MTKLVLVLALVITGCGMHKSWSTTSKVTTTTMVVSLTADWIQTRAITADCMESNPIMGECGENVGPDLYFALSGAALLGIAYLLPDKWRAVFTGGVTLVESKAITKNTLAGYEPF